MIKRLSQKKKKGFSLIELIIVLAVMAIIALIAIPNFNAVKENAKVKSDVQSGNAIARSIETLLVDDSIKLTNSAKKGVITITTTNAEVGNIEEDDKVFNTSNPLTEYLVELLDNEPQEKDKVGYILTINNDTLEVTAVTGTKEEAEAAVTE